MQDDFGVHNGWVDFEIIQHGWDVHYFTNENITELTGLEEHRQAIIFLVSVDLQFLVDLLKVTLNQLSK